MCPCAFRLTCPPLARAGAPLPLPQRGRRAVRRPRRVRRRGRGGRRLPLRRGLGGPGVRPAVPGPAGLQPPRLLQPHHRGVRLPAGLRRPRPGEPSPSVSHTPDQPRANVNAKNGGRASLD